MTALASRLLAEADYTHSLIAEAVGDRRNILAEREALLREAAAALSGGEAVACHVCDGEGHTPDSNSCDYCNGSGVLTTPQPGNGVVVPAETLRWWHELATLNPQDLVPRIATMLTAAPSAKGVAS